MADVYECDGCKGLMSPSECPKNFYCRSSCSCGTGSWRCIPSKDRKSKNRSSQVYQCDGCNVLMDPSECIGNYENVNHECGKGNWHLIAYGARKMTVKYAKY